MATFTLRAVRGKLRGFSSNILLSSPHACLTRILNCKWKLCIRTMTAIQKLIREILKWIYHKWLRTISRMKATCHYRWSTGSSMWLIRVTWFPYTTKHNKWQSVHKRCKYNSEVIRKVDSSIVNYLHSCSHVDHSTKPQSYQNWESMILIKLLLKPGIRIITQSSLSSMFASSQILMVK